MEQEILSFISRRFKADCHWLDGNCYWFSKILVSRFPFLKIYYCPIQGHFVAGTPSHYYDWNGVAEIQERPILFSELKQQDKLWYERLKRDCIM